MCVDGSAAALGKMSTQPSHVLEQCRLQLAKRLDQWTEAMWVKRVPAVLRQRHWRAGSPQQSHQSSFQAYRNLLLLKNGVDGHLDHAVLYLASLEYDVTIHVVTATPAGVTPSLNVAHIHPAEHKQRPARHIVLLYARLDANDHRYEVVQHRTTTVLDNEQHGVLLRRLQQLPLSAASLLPIADPEVDDLELERRLLCSAKVCLVVCTE